MEYHVVEPVRKLHPLYSLAGSNPVLTTKNHDLLLAPNRGKINLGSIFSQRFSKLHLQYQTNNHSKK